MASFYGKFFARNLNLYLLQRNPEQWKTSQTSSKASLSSQPKFSGKIQSPSSVKPVVGESAEMKDPELSQAGDAGSKKQRKRKIRPENEIDQLFEETLGKKIKKAQLDADAFDDAAVKNADDLTNKKQLQAEVKALEDVLGAIKAAPKDRHSTNKRKSGHR